MLRATLISLMDDSPNKKVLVITDLDGTLLDHDNYEFEAALPVLERLRRLKIPVIANTSKTRAEWLAMRSDFQNDAPFVVENGSAIIFSEQDTRILGSTREEITDALNSLRSRFQFQTFQDLELAGIIAQTKLPEAAARRAAQREYSEPLVWQDSEQKQQQFCQIIADLGLMTLEGGRFLHVLGPTNKGKALDLLREHYSPDLIIALGDSPNDLAMLNRADIACVIASHRADVLKVTAAPKILRSQLHGPKGWAELVSPLLDELFLNH